MKEHDEIDEFFRATFQDFKPDASHISDAGISSFVQSQGVAKSAFFAKWGVGAYATVGTVVVAASIVAVQLWTSTPEKQPQKVSGTEVTPTDDKNTNLHLSDSVAAANEYVYQEQSASNGTEIKDKGTSEMPNAEVPNKNTAQVGAPADRAFQLKGKVSANRQTSGAKSSETAKLPTAPVQSVRAIEDYLAEKYPVPLYFNPDGDAPQQSLSNSSSAKDSLKTDSETQTTQTETAVMYTEVQIPIEAGIGKTEALATNQSTASSVLQPQDSGVGVNTSPDLNYLMDPELIQVWPRNSFSVTGGIGLAKLNKTGNEFVYAPYYYPYGSLVSGSTDVERLFSVKYDYRFGSQIALQVGFNYQSLGWNFVRSVIYSELIENPDTSYYQLDTAETYRQQASLTAVGLSLAAGYDFLLSNHWMLGVRFGLSGNQFKAKLTETDLWSSQPDLHSERNAFALSAFGRANLVYRFRKFGIAAGMGVNGRSTMTESLGYENIYHNVSYSLDLGIHYYPGK